MFEYFLIELIIQLELRVSMCSMLAKCQTLLATIIHKRVFSAPISYAAYIVHKIMSITVQNQRTKGEHNNNNWYIIFLYAQKRIINALLVKLL